MTIKTKVLLDLYWLYIDVLQNTQTIVVSNNKHYLTASMGQESDFNLAISSGEI